MREVSIALKEHMAQEVSTLTTCWIIRRRDGRTLFFTEHDQDLVPTTRIGSIDPGPDVIFRSSQGYTRSAMSGRSDLSVDSIDVVGFFADTRLVQEIRARRFDYAEVMFVLVNWADMGMGAMVLKTGYLGELVLSPSGRFEFEVRSLAQRISQVIGADYQPTCRVDLGDPHTCNPPPNRYRKYTGEVTALVEGDRHRFSALIQGPSIGSLAAPGQRYFNGGTLRWTTGENATTDTAMAVRRGSINLVELAQPTPFPAAIGDEFEIWPGCDKRFRTCHQKFNNAVNFRGEPHLPGRDYLVYQPSGEGAPPSDITAAVLEFGTIDDLVVGIGQTIDIELSDFLVLAGDDAGTISWYAIESDLNVAIEINRATGRLSVFGGQEGMSEITVTAEGALGGLARTSFGVSIQEDAVGPDPRGDARWRVIPVQQVAVGKSITIDLSDYITVTGAAAPITYSARTRNTTDPAISVAVTGSVLEITGLRIGSGLAILRATGRADGSLGRPWSVSVAVTGQDGIGITFRFIPTQQMAFGGILSLDLDTYDEVVGDPGVITFSIDTETTDLAGGVVNYLLANEPGLATHRASQLRLAAAASGTPALAKIGIRATGENGGQASTVINVNVGLTNPEASVSWLPIPDATATQDVEIDQDVDLDLNDYLQRSGDVGQATFRADLSDRTVLARALIDGPSTGPDDPPATLRLHGIATGTSVVTVSVRTALGQAGSTTFTANVKEALPPIDAREVPPKVTGVAVRVIGPNTVDVTWNESRGAMSYRVSWERKEVYDQNVGRYRAGGLRTESESTDITGLDPATKYVLVVQASAYNLIESPRATDDQWSTASDQVAFTTKDEDFIGRVDVDTIRWTTLATGNGGAGTLSWAAVTNGARYRIYWHQGDTFPGITRARRLDVSAAEGTSKMIPLRPGRDYTLVVHAIGTDLRHGRISRVFSFTTDGGALTKPDGIALRAGSQRVVFDWADVPGATRYGAQIQRWTGDPPDARVSPGNGVDIAPAGSSGLRFEHTGSTINLDLTESTVAISRAAQSLLANTWYAARAIGYGRYEGQRSPWSDLTDFFRFPDRVRPSPPKNLRATPHSSENGRIDLRWDAVVGTTQYQYRYNLTGTVGSWTYSALTTQTTASVEDLRAGIRYNFQVRSNGGGWSTPAVVARAPAHVLPAPTGLTATPSATADGRIDLKWNAVDGATGYKYRYNLTGTAGSWTTSPRVTLAGVPVTGLQGGTQYNFQVLTVSAAGDGPWLRTPVVARAPALAAPPAPNRPTVGDSGINSLRFDWTASATVRTARRYEAQIARGSSGFDAASTFDISIGSTRYRARGLVQNTSYRFRLRAVYAPSGGSAERRSDWTAARTGTTLARSLR